MQEKITHFSLIVFAKARKASSTLVEVFAEVSRNGIPFSSANSYMTGMWVKSRITTVQMTNLGHAVCDNFSFCKV